MEGKELYNNEDEEFDPKSKKEEDDGDEFGLPEIEESEVKSEDIGDPYPESWNEEKDEDSFASSEPSEEERISAEDETEPDYSFDEEVDEPDSEEDEEYRSSYYEEEYSQKKFPVGWIIFGVFILIAIIVAVFWFLNREEPAPVQVKQPVIEQPVQEEPEPEPVQQEPEPEPEPVRQAGVFEINEPTGRYHVIVASSIDKDLVRDYGNKLAKQGMMCNILAPRGNKKFHRLSVADFVMLNDAAVRSEQLKSTLGEDVWVIRY
ncbi:MAG: SPOR domain-containing protein [Cytophagales bacterium]|nr:SPOR domain-containing protein [Cytophagales bacterium]